MIAVLTYLPSRLVTCSGQYLNVVLLRACEVRVKRRRDGRIALMGLIHIAFTRARKSVGGVGSAERLFLNDSPSPGLTRQTVTQSQRGRGAA
jgi:hypothetical protein